jgi:hypothetical protein
MANQNLTAGLNCWFRGLMTTASTLRNISSFLPLSFEFVQQEVTHGDCLTITLTKQVATSSYQ